MEEKKSGFMPFSLKQVCKKVVLDTCPAEEIIASLPNDLVDELCDYATTISKGLLISKTLRNSIVKRDFRDYYLIYGKPFEFCVQEDENAYPQYTFFEIDHPTEVIKNSICFTGNDNREMLKNIAHFSDKKDLINKIYDLLFITYTWRRPSLLELDAIEPLRLLKIYKLLEYCLLPSRKIVNLDYLHGLFEGRRDGGNTSCLQGQIKNLIDLSKPQCLGGMFNFSNSLFIEENNSKEKSEITKDDKNWLPFFTRLHTKAFCYGLSFDSNNQVNEVDFRNTFLSKNVYIIKAFLMPYIANLYFKQKQARRIEKDKDLSRERGIPSVGGISYVSAFSKLIDTFDGTKEIYFHMNYHRYAFTRTLYAPLRRLSVCYKKNKLSKKYKKGYVNLFDLDYTNLFKLFKTLKQESNNYKIATIHSLYDAIANELTEVPKIDVNFSENDAQELVHKIGKTIVQQEYNLILPDDHYYILKTTERTTAKNRDSAIVRMVKEFCPQKIISAKNEKCLVQ